ncbi:MAG: FKBP-type peptidyl-prolyl cis-trans isomerase [Nevskiales bacterium]
MQIADRRVAQFHYTLTNDQDEVLDSSSGHEPLTYLHGKGNIVPGLEKALLGKQAGDKLKVSVPPDEGYGLQLPELIQVVPRDAFQGVADIKIGMRFQAETGQGQVLVRVTGVTTETVTVDGNHELAGQTLHFEVEITDIRDASVEEVLHGHVHGPGGHHH